jgi:hypothetical protein
LRNTRLTLAAILIIALSNITLVAATNSATPGSITATLQVTAANGKNITLTTNGNVSPDQISELWFANNEALYNNTDIAFKLTGQNNTAQFMNMTVPKNSLLANTAPVITIDGSLAENAGYTQDQDNFYVWFTAASNREHLNRSNVQITFLLTPKIMTIQPPIGYLYTFGAAIIAILLSAVFLLVGFKRHSNKHDLQQQVMRV